MERKLVISRADRIRWGALRRSEATRALCELGIAADSATFLGFADSRCAALARRGDPRLRDQLAELIRAWQPTTIVSPSTYDMHADHRAVAWFAHQAVRAANCGTAPALVTYVVHGTGPDERLALRIDLSESELARKRAAIECHASQLLLSRERFVGHAQRREAFYRAEHDRVHVESRLRVLQSKLHHAALVFFGTPAERRDARRRQRREAAITAAALAEQLAPKP